MCRQNQVQYIHIYIYVYTWPIRSPCHEKAVKVLPFNGHWTWYGFLWQCFISCCHAYYNFSFGINLLTIYYVISYQYDQNNVNLCTSNCNRYIHKIPEGFCYMKTNSFFRIRWYREIKKLCTLSSKLDVLTGGRRIRLYRVRGNGNSIFWHIDSSDEKRSSFIKFTP